MRRSDGEPSHRRKSTRRRSRSDSRTHRRKRKRQRSARRPSKEKRRSPSLSAFVDRQAPDRRPGREKRRSPSLSAFVDRQAPDHGEDWCVIKKEAVVNSEAMCDMLTGFFGKMKSIGSHPGLREGTINCRNGAIEWSPVTMSWLVPWFDGLAKSQFDNVFAPFAMSLLSIIRRKLPPLRKDGKPSTRMSFHLSLNKRRNPEPAHLDGDRASYIVFLYPKVGQEGAAPARPLVTKLCRPTFATMEEEKAEQFRVRQADMLASAGGQAPPAYEPAQAFSIPPLEYCDMLVLFNERGCVYHWLPHRPFERKTPLVRFTFEDQSSIPEAFPSEGHQSVARPSGGHSE